MIEWNLWRNIPARYNLGVHLTRGQVERGLGAKAALHWENSAGEQRTFTFAEMDALSSRFASALSRLGIGRGDRVFLRLPNVPEFYLAALGIAKLGAVFIPSSTQFHEDEVRYRLLDSESVAVVTTPNLVEPVDRVRGDCPALQHVILTRGQGDWLDFWKLTESGDEAFASVDTANDETAFIAYTSGTTGHPKGVVHLQRYPISYESLLDVWHDYRSDDVVACPSEVGWMLPVASTFLFSMSRGLTAVLYDGQGRFDAEAWFRLMAKYRVTSFTAPPTTYRMLMAAADAGANAGHDLSAWRHGVSAGEALPADTLDSIRKHFGVTVLDGIGMSECYVYCCNRVGEPLAPGSCGRPTPGTVIDLLDDEMRPVADGQPGVLCVRRDSQPGMLREYWRKPEQTAAILRGDWYVSGDVMIRDGEGRLWFQGRNDDVIKASGYRISPFEVESCLVSHPAILEAAAVESPDALRGNVVKAFVVLRAGFVASDALAAEIQAFAKQQVAGYKHPRRIEFVASLPKTTSGKIKRRELRQREFSG